MVLRKFSEISNNKPIFSQYNIFYIYEYFFFQCEFYLNHCQRSQSNQEQGSLCCSLPCFHVLLCTQYGPLQCFFGKLKEIGVLRPIFLFSCDYILVLCPTLATLAPLFVHTKIENWYLIYLCALQHNLQTIGRETVLAMIKTISSSAAGQWPIYSVWKKVNKHMLLPVQSFLIFYFSFRLCSTWCADILWNTL